jgi:hypothetical protein
MSDFVRDHVRPIDGLPLLPFAVVLLALLLAACAPVNARDPVTVKQQFRADLAGFCLRNPEAVGCEKFSKGVQR